jgi:hypothetical protein
LIIIFLLGPSWVRAPIASSARFNESIATSTLRYLSKEVQKFRLGIISTRPVFNCHPPDCGNAPAARAINFYEVEPDFHHVLVALTALLILDFGFAILDCRLPIGANQSKI